MRSLNIFPLCLIISKLNNSNIGVDFLQIQQLFSFAYSPCPTERRKVMSLLFFNLLPICQLLVCFFFFLFAFLLRVMFILQTLPSYDRRMHSRSVKSFFLHPYPANSALPHRWVLRPAGHSILVQTRFKMTSPLVERYLLL